MTYSPKRNPAHHRGNAMRAAWREYVYREALWAKMDHNAASWRWIARGAFEAANGIDYRTQSYVAGFVPWTPRLSWPQFRDQYRARKGR